MPTIHLKNTADNRAGINMLSPKQYLGFHYFGNKGKNKNAKNA